MKCEQVDVLGMKLDRWSHESCVAHIGTGDGWATVYDIESSEPGQGHATALLRAAKAFYEGTGKEFGGSVALNTRMRRIYEHLGIKEFGSET